MDRNIEEFHRLASNGNTEPFVMLNLVNFKGESGAKIYADYMAGARTYTQKYGAEVLYLGRPNEFLYGTEKWDLMLLVRYPSRRAFLDMTSDPGYLEVHKLRQEALESAVLCVTDPITTS